MSLLVAVTVVLSVAAAGFTMGLSPPEKVPQAGFSVTQEGVAADDESSVTVLFAHESGQGIDTGNLEVRVGGSAARSLSSVSVLIPAGTLASGDSITLSQVSTYGLTGGESVSLVYVTENESTILATHEVDGQDPGSSLESLSFESGDPGDTTPPSPWEHVLNPQNGSMEIQSSPVSEGSRALRIQGSGDGTGSANGNLAYGQNVGVTVDLTDVAEIRYDVYVISSNSGKGELRMMVFQNGGEEEFDGLASADTGRWVTDRSIPVSDLSGEAQVIAHADGSQNEAIFDNVRFYDENGDRIPASEILVD